MNMVAFHNVAAITMLQGWGDGLHGLEEEVHPDGKVRAVEKRGFAFVDQLPNLVHMLIPAGGSYHDGSTGLSAADDIGHNRMRCGEIDDNINLLQKLPAQSAAILVFLGAQCAHLMPAPARSLGHEGAGLAPTQYCELHANT